MYTSSPSRSTRAAGRCPPNTSPHRSAPATTAPAPAPSSTSTNNRNPPTRPATRATRSANEAWNTNASLSLSPSR